MAQGRTGRPEARRRGEPEKREFDEVVVKIYRCATVVKGGRRFSFSALVVVGDRNGRVGVGYGKAPEVPTAVEKARKIATQSMKPITRQGTTIPHRITMKYGAAKVVLVPASPGTGVIAGASVRPVLELSGIHDVLTKSYGSNSPKNLVRATHKALTSLLNRQQVAEHRGVEIAG
ncbi:MAG: 30S ribosomal protein S5 [bacterium]|nr:30S ribosomal protein S5 [bacterium]